MRKKELKYRHLLLHEIMLDKIHTFDNQLLKLNVSRNDVKLRLTHLDLFALQLEQELLILNEYDLIEDEYSYNVFIKTGVQNDKITEVSIFLRYN